MQVKVTKKYVDRITKELIEVGTVTEYTESRAKELEQGGYVEVITEDEEERGDDMSCKKGGNKKK